MLGRQQLQQVFRLSLPRIAWLGLATMLVLSANLLAQSKESAMTRHTSYQTVKVDGLSIFYREAGPRDAPTLLLLHGLPSSSRMFEPLLTRLAGDFHMVAPDYPGFGHSDAPTPKDFAYTFDNIARVMEHFTEALGLTRTRSICRTTAGRSAFAWCWLIRIGPRRSSFRMPSPTTKASAPTGKPGARSGPTVPNTKPRCGRTCSLWPPREHGTSAMTRTPRRYDPDLWTDEYAFLNKPGEADIQSDLFYDYRTNVDAYPKWQAWMQKTQPRLMVLWGKYESSFDPSEPEAYRRDVPKAEVHILDGGHFALDTAADEIADLVRGFMSK